MQDLGITLHQRYVAGKESIEVVLEASKRAIPSTIEALRTPEPRDSDEKFTGFVRACDFLEGRVSA